MNIEQAQMCPWVSILPHAEIQNLTKEKEIISLIKMLVNVTLQAVTHYENGEYGHLDALVGNYGCEVHAFNILSLAHSAELKEECKTMLRTCQAITQWIQGRQSVLNPIEKANRFGALDQVYIRLQGMSMISLKMKYLIQSRLLTVTKGFVHDATKFDDREYENLQTIPSNLRNVSQTVPVQDRVLKAIVSTAQSCMSQDSILLMRAELEKLSASKEKEGLLIKKMMSSANLCTYTQPLTGRSIEKNGKNLPKTYSCSYYNTKAILLLLAELNLPLIIKKMTKLGEPTKVFAFRPCKELGKFEQMESCAPETPVIVCLAYLPDQMSDGEWLQKVRKYGLGNMILASASQGSQYVPQKPEVFPIREPDAVAEVCAQNEIAKEIECVWKNKSIFDLDHFYCTSWQRRSENLGEINL